MILRRTGAVMTAFFLLFVFFGALPASADPATCSQPIVDTTTKSVLNTQQVEAAVTQLTSVGADVYVRAFQKTPNSSIEAYYRDQYTHCSGWQSPDGKTPKGNLIFVAFGMDHTSFIAYGSNWHQLDGRVDAIRSNSLNANLRSGDFTAAITATLTQLESAIKAPANSSQSSQSEPGHGAAIGMGVLYVVGGIVVLILLLFAGWRLVVLYDRKKTAKHKLQKAQVEATNVRQKTIQLYTELMNGTDSKADNETLALQTLALPTVETRKYEGRLKTIQGQLTAAVSSYNELEATSPELTLQSRNLENLETFTKRYNNLQRDFSDVDQKMAALWKELKELNYQLTPEGRQESLSQLQIALDTDSQLLATISAFSTADYQKRLTKLSQQAHLPVANVGDNDDNWSAYQAIQKMVADEKSLANDLKGLDADQREILRAPQELADKLASTKHLVKKSGLGTRKTTKFNKQLDNLELSIAAFDGDPDRSIERVRSHKDSLHKSLDNVAKACKSEQRKRSYDDSYNRPNDSFGNGLVGGYLGATLGNDDYYGHSDTSSNSTSSYDYGGSSGGDWGGGGGIDFGGSSGGSW